MHIEVLQIIQQRFDFMTKEQCVPIETALKLMDQSSLGLADQYDEFQRTHQELQRALKAIVNGAQHVLTTRDSGLPDDRTSPGLQ
jgi:NADH:ubiquinone oxidoreductase subunit E